MKALLLAAALATVSGQAHALSCLRPDPIATFKQVAEAPESYFVLYGELTFDEDALPAGVSMDMTRAPDPIPARFRGNSLSLEGFTNNYFGDVELQIGCAGQWCGSARSGIDAIYFVRADNKPVTMQANACGGMIFAEPSQATLDMLTSCVQGGRCLSQPLQ